MRHSDCIKTTDGEVISPQKIEGMLTLEQKIAQAIVVGDRRPHLVALLVPDLESLVNWARRRHLIVERYADAFERLNDGLEGSERASANRRHPLPRPGLRLRFSSFAHDNLLMYSPIAAES